MIGILAAIAIPNLFAARDRAHDAATQGYLRQCMQTIFIMRSGNESTPVNGLQCTQLQPSLPEPPSVVVGSSKITEDTNGLSIQASNIAKHTIRFDGQSFTITR